MSAVRVRRLGLRPMTDVWSEMREFTDRRTPATPDEIWFVEHPPVFTLGLNGDPAHVIEPGDIPVVKIDRGGQVTYHGPGQLVCYAMLDLGRRGLSIRRLVTSLETAVIEAVAPYGIEARARRDAPGVYVGAAKLAAIGLRIRRRASYHGLALNVAMDLEPFRRIHPCGFEGLAVTQLADLGGAGDLEQASRDLESALMRVLQEPAVR